MLIAGYTRQELEILRKDAKNKFEERKNQWFDQLLWTLPARAKHLVGMSDRDDVTGYPIFDGSHVLAQRSCVAGFLEGNTSASRPWIRYVHADKEVDQFPAHRAFLEKVSQRALSYLSTSNFYHEAGQFYYDWSSVDTGCHVVKRRGNGVHWFTLLPGSYYIINNAWGEPEFLFREFTLHSVALVKRYGKKKNGNWDWSNFSNQVKTLFDRSDTSIKIECVEVYCRNKNFNPSEAMIGRNGVWTSAVYETGVFSANGFNNQFVTPDKNQDSKYLETIFYRRKPFVVGKSNGDVYGDRGPTTDSIGIIRSLNKKAVSKDIALEKMLDPTTQGPAGIHKKYLTLQARGHVPIDPMAFAQGGIKPIYDIRGEGISALTSDQADYRNQVEKFYYADFLLFLSSNPKTRTATEAQGVIEEQKSVLGPMLQSLTWSYNTPIADYMLDFVIENDPYIGEIPEGLQGQPIGTQFVSPFAQAQNAFDLPTINMFVDRWVNLAQINQQAWTSINLQKLADIYGDRYQLPAGLINSESKVSALIAQAEEAAMRQQQLESIPALAQAGKNAAQAQQIGQEVTNGRQAVQV